MSDTTLRVALVTAVFHDAPAGDGGGGHPPGADASGGDRLRDLLQGAAAAGADLAVLPELPLDRWSPATREPDPDDAEEPGGPRQSLMSEAAAGAGIALVGGAIVRDPATGRRHNTALVYARDGRVLARYRKLHLPSEEGFWESDHYEPGSEPPGVVDLTGVRLGLQICSDVNRPSGLQLLAARGAEVVCVPRATPAETWARWRLVLRAGAVTSAAWVVSVNRPGPEGGVPIGGPSVVIAPDGTVAAESTDPVAVVTLDRDAARRARADYPGYLPLRAGVYAEGWRRVEEAR